LKPTVFDTVAYCLARPARVYWALNTFH